MSLAGADVGRFLETKDADDRAILQAIGAAAAAEREREREDLAVRIINKLGETWR